MTLPLHDYPDWQPRLFQADRLTDDSLETLTSGSNTSSGLLDMRQYASIALRVKATVSGVAAAFHPVTIAVHWQDGVGDSDGLSVDTYMIWAHEEAGGAFDIAAGLLHYQSPVKAPYCIIYIVNNGTADVDVGWSVISSSRQLTHTSAREVDWHDIPAITTADTFLGGALTNVAGGATTNVRLRMHVGRVQIRWAQTTTAFNVAVNSADGRQIDLQALAIGARIQQEYILPAQSCFIALQNTGGAASNIRWNVIALRDVGT